jgi:hypothetical protein
MSSGRWDNSEPTFSRAGWRHPRWHEEKIRSRKLLHRRTLSSCHVYPSGVMAISIQDGITLGLPGINVRFRYPETLCNKLAWWENTLSCASSFDFILLDYHLYGIPDALMMPCSIKRPLKKKITQSKIYRNSYVRYFSHNIAQEALK